MAVAYPVSVESGGPLIVQEASVEVVLVEVLSRNPFESNWGYRRVAELLMLRC